MVEAATRELSGWLDVRPAEAGMPLVVAWRHGSHRTLSTGSNHHQRGGLLPGYAAVGEEEIRTGMSRLVAALT